MFNGSNFSRACIVIAISVLFLATGLSFLSSGDVLQQRCTGTGGASSNFGWNITMAGDVNNDGNDDILIGAPGENKAYLFYGPVSSTELDAASADVTITGPASSEFGWSVSTAFKLNSGSNDDIIIGSPAEDPPCAYIFFGENIAGPSMTQADADVVLNGSSGSRFGHAVTGVGDFNGDGNGDVWVGAPLELGPPVIPAGPILPEAGVAYFFNDVASNPSWFVGELNFGPALNISGIVDKHHFGWSIDFAGFKFDSQEQFADVVIGGPGYGPEGYPKNDGSAHVEFGKTVENGNYKGTPNNYINAQFCDLNIFGDNSSAVGGDGDHRFGWDVSYAKDFNGDGKDDIIVGAPGSNSKPGSAHVIYGGANGELHLNGFSQRDYTIRGAPSVEFGSSVSWLGDFNQDGSNDIAVGAQNTAEGKAFVFYGPGGAIDPMLDGMSESDLNITGEGAGDMFGSAVACAGVSAAGRTSNTMLVSAKTASTGKVYLYTVNRPCSLSLMSVNKSSGNALHPFKFAATYTDLEDDDPTHVKVHIYNDSAGNFPITGSPFDMNSGDSTYFDGSEHTFTTTLPHGQIYYQIEAKASAGDDQTVMSNIRTGPLVDTIAPGMVTDLVSLDHSTIVSPTDGDIELLWTFPGDDGFNTAKVFNGQLRYRNETESHFYEGNFNKSRIAQQWMLSPAPLEGNSQGQLRIKLEAAEKYYFCFRAADEEGNWGSLSNEVEAVGWFEPDYIPPIPIKNVVAEDVGGDNGGYANVTWELGDEPDIAKYNIYGAKTPFLTVDGMNPIVISTDTQDAWAVVDKISDGTALKNGEYYYFAVTAQDTSGNMNKNVTVSNRVRITNNYAHDPDTLTGVEVEDTPDDEGGSLTVFWDATDNKEFDCYKIYVSENPFGASLSGQKNETAVYEKAETSTTVTTRGGYDLKEGKKYYVAVTVQTINDKENLLITTQNTAGPMYAMDNTKGTKPGTIRGLAAEDKPNDKGGAISLAWTKYTGVTFGNYYIYIDTEPITSVDGMEPEVVLWDNLDTTTVNSMNGNKLVDGVDYYVAVTVVSYNGVEDNTVLLEQNSFGPVISINNSDRIRPPAVQDFALSGIDGQSAVNFTWAPISQNVLDFQKYVITYYDVDAEWEVEEYFIEDITVGEVSIVGLLRDSDYIFNISVIDDNGNRGPYSKDVPASPGGENLPPVIIEILVSPVNPTTDTPEITFTCDAEDDKEFPEDLEYKWDFNGDNVTDKRGAQTGWKKYSKPGTYSFSVRVEDSSGAYTVETGTITVGTGSSGDGETDFTLAIILGSVFGFVILILVIIMMIVFIFNKKKAEEEDEEEDKPDEGPVAIYDDMYGKKEGEQPKAIPMDGPGPAQPGQPQPAQPGQPQAIPPAGQPQALPQGQPQAAPPAGQPQPMDQTGMAAPPEAGAQQPLPEEASAFLADPNAPAEPAEPETPSGGPAFGESLAIEDVPQQ